MIQRTKKPVEPPAEPQHEAPPGPSVLIELTDLDFNFGPNDACELTLGPDDRLNVSPETFVIDFAENGERIEIVRERVRWWSRRTRQVAIGQKSFDPAVN